MHEPTNNPGRCIRPNTAISYLLHSHSRSDQYISRHCCQLSTLISHSTYPRTVYFTILYTNFILLWKLKKMSSPYGADALPRPHTRLPAINRSPSPTFLESMKDLVPAPLRQKRSQLLRSRTSEEVKKTQPTQIVSARNGWDYYGQSQMPDRSQARSASPVPASRSPLPARARSPRQRYLHVPPEYLTTKQTHCPSAATFKKTTLPIANSMALSVEPHQPMPSSLGMGSQIQLNITAPKSRKPRNYVPSMIDYLSLEQLEEKWESQDLYKGPVDVPIRVGSPMWRIDEHDPRSPLHPEAIHPAFRAHVSIHNSYAREII